MKFAVFLTALAASLVFVTRAEDEKEHPVLRRIEEITLPKKDAAESTPAEKQQIGCILVEERPLQQVVDYLSTVSGMNIRLQSESLKKILIGKDCFGEKLTYHDILELICRKHKLKLDESLIQKKIIVIYRPESITLSFKDAEVRDVILTIAAAGNLNIVIDPEIQGKVTANLKDVDCVDALDVIVKSLGYVAVRERGSFLINEK